MAKLTGKISGASINFETQLPLLTLEVNEKNDFFNCFDELKDVEKISIEIKPYREKRSLNANAYAWKLIGAIADIVQSSKDEVYVEMLRKYGQSDIISVLANINIGGYIKYYDEAGESKLNGKLFRHYKVYKGSSEYDTKEMATLIDGIVGEAKELGIQTETPEEIARMKSLWRE